MYIMKGIAMKQNNSSTIHNFFEALKNIFIFLPYFFSVTVLLKTLFSPWKNITTKSTRRGFSISDIFNTISFNIISRSMGFAMRTSILIFYLLVLTLYLFSMPIIIMLFFVALPIITLIQSSQKTESQAKTLLKQEFIKNHILKEENLELVSDWFEKQYAVGQKKKHWWKLHNLFETPPLGRDWSVGYTPTLDEFAEDLTKPTYQIAMRKHIIGRDAETAQIEQILSQSNEANAILVGENGVGKHTILNALARKVYEGKTNTLLAYKRILSLNMEKLMTENTDQKMREESLELILTEAAESKSVILLIDNFDRYITSEDNRVDMTIPIEKFAKSSAIQFIGITTPFMYEKFIFPKNEIRNIFTRIDVKEVTNDIALQIILEKIPEYEYRYNVFVPYETIITTIEKSSFYINTVPFPEKALQLIDAICVYTKQLPNQTIVMPESIDIVLSQKIHVPTTLTAQVKEKLLHLEELLREKILGQEEAISEVSATLRRAFLLLGKRKKPLSSFLLLGPTGVGKTETAKVISEVFFGKDRGMLRFDMSLFQTKEDIAKLIGSIEKLNPGLLTNAIRENPYGVLLIDEIEKAHHDLLNIFLTLLDEGYFMDGYGQRVDGKNLIIIATSNAGSEHIYQVLLKQSMQNNIDNHLLASNELSNYLIEQHIFSPEFLNRFDGIIAYKPIQQETATQIARSIVDHIAADINKMYGVTIKVEDKTLKDFSSQGYNTQYGVRNLERILRQRIEDTVAKQILGGKAQAGDTIQL
ncbi:N/A [soil metagenome]